MALAGSAGAVMDRGDGDRRLRGWRHGWNRARQRLISKGSEAHIAESVALRGAVAARRPEEEGDRGR